MPVLQRPERDPFAVYVHWPFCAAKCPYCDFNSHVRHDAPDQESFAQGLCREIRVTAARIGDRRTTSIFFGGGTPSLMEAETVARVISAIDQAWPLETNAEITLEANPTSAEAKRFAGYAAAGVNRLSIGVQSLDDDDLQALGRLHSADEAIAALQLANRTVPRTSIDLIYARPNQSLNEWRDELSRALELGLGHYSLYQLTIEAGTPFAERHARGRLPIPDASFAADMYELTSDLCALAGLEAYEISNYAGAGGKGRHNLVYWRYGEYAGIGPGAHGRLIEGDIRIATETERHPETWLKRVEEHGTGVIDESALSLDTIADEYLLMALRLSEGADLDRFETLAGRELPEFAYMPLVRDEFLELTANNYLAATKKGRPVLNRIITELAAQA